MVRIQKNLRTPRSIDSVEIVPNPPLPSREPKRPWRLASLAERLEGLVDKPFLVERLKSLADNSIWLTLAWLAASVRGC